MNLTFTGKKLLFIIPLVVIVFFVFSHFKTAQAVNTGQSPINKSSGAAVMAATPDYWETKVAGDDPVAAATESLQATPTSTVPDSALPSLDDFISRVKDGQPGNVDGLYIQGITALRIVQQPKGNPGYVDPRTGTVTQFQSANDYGAVGLLAHNFLAGSDFFRIKAGQDMILVYGDGSVHHYQVATIADYQRLTPTDLQSDFVELASSQQMTVDQVFGKFYRNPHHLVLQTCILNNGNPDWGVRFIDGSPVQ